MLRALWMIALIAALALPAFAAEKARPHAEGSKGPFKVVVLITTDSNWRQKWNTPKEHSPEFRGPGVMKRGDKAWILTLFSNAKPRNGEVVLHCDAVFTYPDGTSKKHPAQLCFQGPATEENVIFMTGVEIGLEVAADDLSGIYGFEIGVTDVHRGVRVPVKVTVEFDTSKGTT